VSFIRNVSEPCVCILNITALAQGTRYSNVTNSLLLQFTLLAQATITLRPVTPLLNTAFRQSVPSQILFSITSGFVVTNYNQQCTFFCRVAFSTGTCGITLQQENHCSLGKFKSHIPKNKSNFIHLRQLQKHSTIP
jgi:hypothetical protein